MSRRCTSIPMTSPGDGRASEKRLSKSKGSEVLVAATTVEIYVRQQGRHSIRLAGKLRSPVVRVNAYNF